ncbi:hypothetical protein IMSAG049_01248 [Clostridiales bacterium]|nr:hypothetical protein IMSAG049_01248 [Clostridiales bacterium]
MTDSCKLKKFIDKSNLSYKEIADKMGISEKILMKKLENHDEFRSKEIQLLCSLLSIEDIWERQVIFFEINVEEKETNTELIII